MSAGGNVRPTLLHEFFEDAAALYPERIAIDVPPGNDRPRRSVITYRELAATVDAIAAHLRPLVRTDDVVAISLPRDSHWLYAAQLAVLRAGGAFTCIDPAFPNAQIRAIVEDGAPRVLLTDAPGAVRFHAFRYYIEHTFDIRALREQSEPTPARPRSDRDLAYIIYTSGTTGAPKGVMIEHRSIVNLVASDLDEFGLAPGDRVAQGSSAAYDSSLEETWLALASGATLVVMDDSASRLGPDLVPWLKSERISVFCPPPTLLRTTGCNDPHIALPDLRLLYVGGEALTPDLADRWAKGRRLVNGYGPTECTVTVVRADIVPGRAVTIGTPVRGHRAFVLDENLEPVANGAEGELCISGVGLTRGYRNKPEITAQKLPEHATLGRIYRTGDLVRRNSDGDLEYLGRIDAQIKLRGYRVELEAIEAHIARCPGVREAACRVQGPDDAQLLAAHIVAADASQPPDLDSVRAALRLALPAYMIPARMALVPSLARSVGGKIDRRSLAELPGDARETGRSIEPARNPLEERIVDAFRTVLRTTDAIGIRDDFFADLGGDSLSAVGVVCELRTNTETAHVTTRDVFQARTAARLAEAASSRVPARNNSGARRKPRADDVASPRLVTVLQSAWLLLALCIAGALGYGACFEFVPWLLAAVGATNTLMLTPVLAAFGGAAYSLASITLAIAAKWVFIGRYRAAVTPAWSELYFRHWIVEQTARMVPWGWLAGTGVYSLVLRALGAKIGRRVHIHHGVELWRGGWDLLTLGDDVTLNCDSWVGLVELDEGCLHIAPVSIGDRATLGVRAGVSGHSSMGADSHLTALSWLGADRTIPAGERWDGVPAEFERATPSAPAIADSRSLSPALHSSLLILSLALSRLCGIVPALAVIGAISAAAGVDAQAIIEWLSSPTWDNGLLPIVLAALVVWTPCALILRALALRAVGRIEPGVFGRWSLAYIRVWHKTREVESAGRWLSGTLFWPVWLRLAGMRIGRKCEISTIIDVVPECVSIGDETFFADGIYLGGPAVDRGTVTIGKTSLGPGTFMGNHVVVPCGVALPDHYFAGVCTVANQVDAAPGTAWFGHPAIELPRREVVGADRSVTHEPGLARRVSRLSWESLRFAIPVVPVLLGSWWLTLAASTHASESWAVNAFVLAPLLLLGTLGAACALILVLKWALLWRARSGQHPLWSCWCSRWDFLYVAWQFYALAPLTALQGTLLLNVYLRASGAHIGKRVVLGPGLAQLVDPDMLFIEDGATVNANFQAHTFEDRVLKIAPVHIRRGASVGEHTVVFYGADIGEGAWVGPNGVVMKNESLVRNTEFVGCPVRPAQARTPLDETETRGAVRNTERIVPLDIARGLAVIGMIFLHFVPADESLGAPEGVLSSLAKFLEGKPAALFCVLAGFAWELQLRRSAWGAQTIAYFVRRSAALAAVGVVLHALAWPTEVLVPLSMMMLACVLLRRAGRGAIAGVTLLVLAATPIAHSLFAEYIRTDWLDDGGHLADSTIGWAAVRALLFDGNYPLLPWLAFPLIGMLLASSKWNDIRWCSRALACLLLTLVLSQAYAYWAAAHAGSLSSISPLLVCEWVPTTLPFFLVAASAAVMVVVFLLLAHLRAGLSWALRPLSLIGRASLSHYLLHILAVYTPLRLWSGGEEWSVEIGVIAFLGYLALAAPASALWFRRFTRGPAESLWARASGDRARA